MGRLTLGIVALTLLLGCDASSGAAVGPGGTPGTGGTGGSAGGGGAAGGDGGAGGLGGTGGSAGGGGAAGGDGSGGDGGAGGVAGAGGTGGIPDARPSAGCGNPGSPGASGILTMTVRGKRREYVTQVPTPYEPNTPLPLVFNPHEHDGYINPNGGWDLGVPNEAVFVWPQGLDYVGDGESSWNLTCAGEDMELMDALLTEIGNTRCIDLSKVFSFGYSYGAQMSVALACCWDSQKLRAIAPVSGNWEDYWQETPECDGIDDPGFLDPPSMRLSYGTHDHIFPEPTFDSLSARYRLDLSCDVPEAYEVTQVEPCDRTDSVPGPTVTCECRTYRGCDRPYTDCKFQNMGHDIPEGYEIDTWAYFSSFASGGAGDDGGTTAAGRP